MSKIRIAVYPAPQEGLPHLVAAFAPGLDQPQIIPRDTLEEAEAIAEKMANELETRIEELRDEQKEN